MAGYPSNLAKKFSPTEQFPQHILPLLLLYNAQWWGYELLTAIVLVNYGDLYHIDREYDFQEWCISLVDLPLDQLKSCILIWCMILKNLTLLQSCQLVR